MVINFNFRIGFDPKFKLDQIKILFKIEDFYIIVKIRF